MAIRLSRAFTGRNKILRFAENFHGWADEVVFPPTSPGTAKQEVTVIPYDLKRVEEELSTCQYAILMTEGGGAHMTGMIPLDFDFVRALPRLAQKYGTVWHLDEVVTGFRDAVGGFQEMVGVKPDLTSLGKIVAGGLGAGALVGRADIMAILDPKTGPEKQVVHSGTWNGNPLTSAAAVAGLKLCRTGDPQKKANMLAAELRKKGNRMMREKAIQGWLYGRSITHLYLGPLELEPSLDTLPPTRDVAKMLGGAAQRLRLSLHLLQRGISTLQARMFILSSAHTEDDVDNTVAALAASFEAMISEGSF
jgi:glutamate-1-semialdehyde 2,1-aminomutase